MYIKLCTRYLSKVQKVLISNEIILLLLSIILLYQASTLLITRLRNTFQTTLYISLIMINSTKNYISIMKFIIRLSLWSFIPYLLYIKFSLLRYQLKTTNGSMLLLLIFMSSGCSEYSVLFY